ncbi:hypothetical protein [Nocardia huaxiensis]|uniref:nSTAND1 domain-containing NTPase n=1 Tax=Nocardia huaxiensis TaxID=2755382 RepID=UPI001E4E33E6|nr:hypothetical protein [Nocardia huaxiensis]UFS96149.1 hypothetical protein LPY97_36830 [Nocardia huaxiensis]
MTDDSTTDVRTTSPRADFARRFAELYAAAGNPTLRRVATAAENRMRAAHGNRAGGASAQRISDWKAGRNVPARFESLLPVVLTLIDLVRKSGTPLARELAETREWQRLWHAATTWDPDADTESACPYPGLTSYGPRDRHLFFGRTRNTAELTALVRETAGSATRIVAVVGASGAGKSSLLAAGLAPSLTDWNVTAFTPGTHPVTALRAATENPGAGSGVVPAHLLLIDQFEELFTTCDSEPERAEFLTALHDCATRAEQPVTVVLAVRADFYGHCLSSPVLQDTLEHRSYLLGPMRMDELAQAISGPARAAGLELETGLEELVITELCGAEAAHDHRGYDPGALPLLSHVMAATWQHREGRRLTVSGYRKAGGVVGSVAETAENAWNELTPPQQEAAHDILLALVAVGQDSRDTRRPGNRAELLRRAATVEDATAALELLSAARLVSLDADAVTLTHEIVLSSWPRLRGWIDSDRVGYLVRQRTETDAVEWNSKDREPSLLYSGARLQQALDNTGALPAGSPAHEFLAASTAARDHAQRRSSRGKAILALLGVVLLILGFATYTQTRSVREQRADRTFAAVVAEANRQWTSNPALSAQLYLVAHELRPGDPDVEAKLLQTQHIPLAKSLSGHTEPGQWAGYVPGGRALASIGSEALQLWDMQDPLHPRKLGQPIPDVQSATFSPDGTLMATPETNWSTYQWKTRLWDIRDLENPRELATLHDTEAGQPDEAVFLADGRTLAVLTASHLQLWDITVPAAPIPGRAWPVSNGQAPMVFGTLELSADRKTLAVIRPSTTDSFDTVQLWNVSAPSAPARIPGELRGPSTGIREAAFSPDGRLLAIGTGNSSMLPLGRDSGKVQIWDISDPTHPRTPGPILETGESGGHGLAFSPDSRVLAAGTDDGAALWNIVELGSPTRIGGNLTLGPAVCHWRGTSKPCEDKPSWLTFGPDGATLTGVSSGGALIVWSLPTTVLDGHAGWTAAPMFDSTGQRMVTASTDGRITVWDARNPLTPLRIGEHRLEPELYNFTLSPDGRTLVVNDFSTTAILLDLSDPAHIRQLGTWQQSEKYSRWMLSPDWNFMATTDGERTIQLWDLSDLAHPAPIGTTITTVWRSPWVVFGPGNRTIAVTSGGSFGLADSDGFEATLWDIADPAHPRTLGELLRAPAGSPFLNITFTPDLATMLVADGSSLQNWDISDPARPARLGAAVTTNPISVGAIEFSADGRTMLTGGGDSTVQLWDYTDRANPTRIGSPIVDPGPASWAIGFGPGDRILAGATLGGEIRLWDLDVQHAIDRACAVTGELWTPELWERYLPQLAYDPPCD